MKRMILFGATNMAVIAVLSIVLRLLGVDQMLGSGMTQLLVFSFALGMVGSIISLFMSKGSALKSTGAKVISEPSNETEAWLVRTVEDFARESGIGMPDVAIYNSSEVEGVLAHEVAHIANGDMITMTLLQGVVNTFVIFFARLIGQVVSQGKRGFAYFIAYMVAQTVLGFFASMITSWFSRHREYRADAGAAELAGEQKMVAALERLQSNSQPASLPKEMQAMGISGLVPKNWKKLFSTHPPLEQRIAALQERR